MAKVAFHSGRVTKSLEALESYIAQAADIADRVRASETLRLELEAASPQLKLVLWKNGKNAIKALELGDPTKPITVKVSVSGSYLTHRDDAGDVVLDIESFELAGPRGARFEATGKALTPSSDDKFDAVFTLPPGGVHVGSYDARAVREDGQRAEQKNACMIVDGVKPDTSSTTGSRPGTASAD